MKSILTPEKIEFIKNNYGKLPTQEIADFVGISKKYLIFKSMKLGINNVYRPRLDHKLIIKQYIEDRLNFKDIARIHKVDRETIKRLLEICNIEIRDPRESYKQYSIDETYFEKIDSEQKAYWLGMLYADGNLKSLNDKYKHKLVKLTQHKKDRYILESFKACLRSEHPIKDSIRSSCSDFYFCNSKIYDDLNALGCVPKKSLILEFPSVDIVPIEHIRHFIRGFFDGDGSVYFNNKTKNWKVTFSTTKKFLESLRILLAEHNIKLGVNSNDKRNKPEWGQAGISGGGSIKKEKISNLYDFLYKDSTIFLKRKRERFEKILQYKSLYPNWPSLPNISGRKREKD